MKREVRVVIDIRKKVEKTVFEMIHNNAPLGVCEFSQVEIVGKRASKELIELFRYTIQDVSKNLQKEGFYNALQVYKTTENYRLFISKYDFYITTVITLFELKSELPLDVYICLQSKLFGLKDEEIKEIIDRVVPISNDDDEVE